MKNILISLFVLSLCLADSIFAQDEIKQGDGTDTKAASKLDDIAMHFWLLSDSITMFTMEKGRYPKSKDEYIEYLEKMTDGTPDLMNVIKRIKGNELIVPGIENPKPEDILLKHRKVGDGKSPYFVLFGNRKIEKIPAEKPTELTR